MSLPIESKVTINRHEWTVKEFTGPTYLLERQEADSTTTTRLPRQYVEAAKEKGDPVELRKANKPTLDLPAPSQS